MNNDTSDSPRKICPGCGEEKPATTEYFHKRSSRPCGMQSECKLCVKARDRERNQRPENKARNKERQQSETVKEWHKQYEKTDKCKVSRKTYRDSHEGKAAAKTRNKAYNARHDVKEKKKLSASQPERRVRKLAKHREYYEATKDRQAEYYREHNKKPESRLKARVRNHKRRAIEANVTGNHTDADILELYDLQDGRCGYCGMPLKFGYHADHMNPISRGGDNGIDNILLTCPTCNWSKNNRPLNEWRQYLYGNT